MSTTAKACHTNQCTPTVIPCSVKATGLTSTSSTIVGCPTLPPYTALPSDMLLPTLGQGGWGGLLVESGTWTQPTVPSGSHDASGSGGPSNSANATKTFISCSTQNADPDQGITSGYCVCSGSTFSQRIQRTLANSCAYTTKPASTIAISTQASTSTITSACEVCTFVGNNGGQCSSIASCTPSSSGTPTSSSSTPAYPTVTSGGDATALCYPTTGYESFRDDDATHVLQSLCDAGNTLTPGQANPYNEQYTNSAGVEVYAEVGWAADQSHCSPKANYAISGDACTAAFNVIAASCGCSPSPLAHSLQMYLLIVISIRRSRRSYSRRWMDRQQPVRMYLVHLGCSFERSVVRESFPYVDSSTDVNGRIDPSPRRPRASPRRVRANTVDAGHPRLS